MSKLPPKWPLRFFRWYCDPEFAEDIEGDLMERFEKNESKWSFTLEVVKLLRPNIIKIMHSFLFYNFFKLAIRRIRKNPSYSFINITGLTIGMTLLMVSLAIVNFENSFDSFHSKFERTYRIVRESEIEGQIEYRSGVVYPLADALRNETVGLESVTSFLAWDWASIQVDVLNDDGSLARKFQENDGLVLAEPSFFKTFDFQGTDFKWMKGSPNVLKDPYSIVITRSMSEKYFGDEDAIGKVLDIDKGIPCTVKGIIEDFPENSDLTFKLIISYSTLDQFMGDLMTSWSSVDDNQSYVVLEPGVSSQEMEQRIAEVHSRHVSEKLASTRIYKLQPFNQLHHDIRFGNYSNRTVPKKRLWIILSFGILLLVVSMINYVNLSTAQASLRLREIGIRKLIGGFKQQIQRQFLIETFVFCLFSAILAFGLTLYLTQNIEGFYGIAIPLHYIIKLKFIGAILLIVLVSTLVGGGYPAYTFSLYKPIKALKSKYIPQNGKMSLRMSLVTVQFVASQISLIGAFVIFNQINMFNTMDLGFDKDRILNVSIPSDSERNSIILSKLDQTPSVINYSLSSTIPSGNTRSKYFMDLSTKKGGNGIVFELQSIDPSFLELYQIQLVAGRSHRHSDSTNTIIINETLSQKLGFSTSDEAIGKPVFRNGDRMRVIGVTADFHSKSLRDEIDKIGFVNSIYRPSVLSIKLSNDHQLVDVIDELESKWEEVYPDFVFDYRFFDETVESYYLEELKFGKITQIFSIVFLFISVLGLYGMVSFIANRRKKEIAIRKVFGAQIQNIMQLLSKEYANALLISLTIAVPLGYYLLQKWLEQFKYRVEPDIWDLLTPSIIISLVTIAIVMNGTFKSLNLSITKTLREE